MFLDHPLIDYSGAEYECRIAAIPPRQKAYL